MKKLDYASSMSLEWKLLGGPLGGKQTLTFMYLNVERSVRIHLKVLSISGSAVHVCINK